MDEQPKHSVIEILERYPETLRKIAVLRYELEHPNIISPDEMIGAMSFARGSGEVHSSGQISNKTLYIAMNYQTEAARQNSEAMDDIICRLVPLEREVDRLEHRLGLLEERQARVLRLYYFERQPWDIIGQTMEITPRTAQKLRKAAIEELEALYDYAENS